MEQTEFECVPGPVGKGCYLTFEYPADGMLFMQWSATPVAVRPLRVRARACQADLCRASAGRRCLLRSYQGRSRVQVRASVCIVPATHARLDTDTSKTAGACPRPPPQLDLTRSVAGSKNELVRGFRGPTRSRFYEGWCSYMKLARDCAGDVVLLTISYVSLWVRQSTGDVIMCPPGKPVSLANATAVAAVGDKDECALCLLEQGS